MVLYAFVKEKVTFHEKGGKGCQTKNYGGGLKKPDLHDRIYDQPTTQLLSRPQLNSNHKHKFNSILKPVLSLLDLSR